MRARVRRQRVRCHDEEILDDPWGTWDWAAAMCGSDDASDMGGPSNGGDPAAAVKPGGDAA